MNRLEKIASRIASDAKGIVGELYKANPDTFKKLFPGESLFYAYAGKNETLLTCSNDNGKVAVFSPSGVFKWLTTWKELVPSRIERACNSLWEHDFIDRKDIETLLKTAPDSIKEMEVGKPIWRISRTFGDLLVVDDPKDPSLFHFFHERKYIGDINFAHKKIIGEKMEQASEKLVETFFDNLASSYDLDLDDRRRWQWLNREMSMQFYTVKNASDWVDRTLNNKDNMAMLAEIDPKAEQDFSKAKALLEQAYALLEPYAVAIREKAVGKE